MSAVARLRVKDQEIELPVVVGTEDEHGVDISKLRAQTGYITLDEGYFSAVLGRQRVTYGDGRLIGTPEWVNFGRVYDGGRASYRLGRAKFEGLFLLPLIALGLYFLLMIVPIFDPGRRNYQNFAKAYGVIRIVMVLFMAFLYGMTILAAFAPSAAPK